MDRYPQLVLIIGPDMANLSHPQLKAQVSPEQMHRLIRCETITGAIHVLKHLRPSLVILPDNVDLKVGTDISSFVGEIVSLKSAEDANDIFHSLLS